MNKRSTLIQSLMDQLENEREEKEAYRRELVEIEQAALKSLELQEALFMSKLSEISENKELTYLSVQVEDLTKQVEKLNKQVSYLTKQLESLAIL